MHCQILEGFADTREMKKNLGITIYGSAHDECAAHSHIKKLFSIVGLS